jgi:putative ABC transport system permease protein
VNRHFFGGGFVMLAIFFKTAWRNIIRGKAYSILNILGLAAGMAVALLIGLWVHDQYRWDRYLPGFGDAYQVKTTRSDRSGKHTTANVCLPLADALRRDVPELAYVAVAFGPVSNMLGVDKKTLSPEGIVVGADFLNIFGFPMIAGDRNTALKDANGIVLTASMARALFGSTDVLGKTLLIDGNTPRRVTAVLADLPDHSSFHFSYLSVYDEASAGGYWRASLTDWKQDFCPIYTALRPNASYATAAPKIRLLMQKYAPEVYRTTQTEVSMQPMKDWRLYTSYENGVPTGGLIDYIRLFSIIGVLVLLIACINFINLSTARSEKRAKEVGIRKVSGSSRGALIAQFLAESVLLTFFAFMLSLLMVQLVLPGFDAITRTTIRMPWSNPYFWLIMLGYVLLTGLLAGCRPAFYLSSFRPVEVLKGAARFRTSPGRGTTPWAKFIAVGRGASLPRKILVVAQFSCSIALIIGTIIVYQQLEYARQRPTGLNTDRLITGNAGYYSYHSLKQEVLRSGMVSCMTKSTHGPLSSDFMVAITDWEGRRANEPLTLAGNNVGDSDYFRTLGTEMVAGRNFVGNYAADSTAVILNETAVKRMRFKQPIGQIISWTSTNGPQRLRVIGVVKDALSTSPFQPAEPTVLFYHPEYCYALTYRLAPNVNTAVALAKLKTIFEQSDPRTAYAYTFVDERYAAEFELEVLTGRLAAVFAILAVFISCLGLFGLAAYMGEQRRKEVGIRKVLGASVAQVVAMLGKEFIVLVLISFVIASPVAFYFLHRWLQGYYYRISIGPGVFVLAALLAIVVTAVTIGYQSFRAALMNPAKSLRAV